MTRYLPGICLFLLSGFHPASAGDEKIALADQAHAVLKQYCHRCHGQDGAIEGGMNYILDRERLVARKKLIPGDAKQSPLWKRVSSGKMPPPSVAERPSPKDIEVIRRWIDEGALAAGPARIERKLLSEAAVLAQIRDDLESIERRSRRFTRYFSLAPLANQGFSADEIQTYRNALAKLLNSLSWHPRIVVPKPIDREGLVLRIDLRDLMWDANLWNRVVSEYPYGVIHDTSAARAAIVGTAARVPVVRADWFIASSSRPPLYYDLLQIPTSAAELERQLRIDVAQNILQERIARAGFNGSGVSRNNRVLERHDAVHGAYWRTYDFDAIPQNLIERDILLPDRRNLFAYPLGPGGTENTFQHAGGEIIFNLPNGLHGFMLVNAENTRIDKGLTAIVSDPKRPDRAVEPCVSCMSCHFSGILQKSDQIRDHVARNKKAFSAKDAELIRALYPTAEKMKSLMDEDAERYRKALEKTGNKITKAEPVSTLTLGYEADVDLETVAAEVGLRSKEFLTRALAQEPVARNLGGLKVQGGTVSRQALVQSYGDIARALRLGTVLQAGATGQNLPDNTGEVDPLEGSANQTNAVAFSRDGRRALLASADKTVRLWNVEAGRELKRFVGHSASVWSVAFSPDGRLGVSGGVDTIIRVWNIEDANENKRLEGHNALVVSVAFSPDSKRILSASLDHTLILWDLESGKEVRRLEGPRHISAAIFAPEGKQALVCADNVMHLYDIESGKEVNLFEGHIDSVTCAMFSNDGKHLLSGADDGSVRLWDVRTGRVIRSFIGHESYVKAVGFSPDGKQVLSGGSDTTVRLWDTATGKELKRFSKHGATILSVSFTPDGTATLSGSNDADVRIWQLVKARPEGQQEPPSKVQIEEPARVRELRPSRIIRTPAPVHALHLSPNGRWLYYLAINGRSSLERIDTENGQHSPSLPLGTGTEALTLTPDGKTLVALAALKSQATIQVVDAPRWAARIPFTVPFSAYDVTADNRGRIYLSGVAGDWTEVAVVDAGQGSVLARWGGIWTRSLLHLSTDEKRLYIATQGVTPGSIDAAVLPSRLDEKPSIYRSPARSERALGGDFLLSPDGKILICKTGVVLRTAADQETDLRHEITLKPSLTGAIVPELAAAFLCTDEGTLRLYSYPELKLKATYRLPGIAHQAVCDAKSGKLYLGVFDPKVLTTRPSERGSGEMHVYDVKDLLPAR
jgi:WD40 repeat protein